MRRPPRAAFAIALLALFMASRQPAAGQSALDILHGSGRPATPPVFSAPPPQTAAPERPPAAAPNQARAPLPRPGGSAARSPEAGPNTLGLKYPGFVRALLSGRNADVPDDAFSRKYVFSYLAVAAELCGAFSSGFSELAIGYVEPRLAAGRDHSAAGWSIANDWAKEFLNAYKSGNVFRMAEAYGAPKTLQQHVEEGVHDAGVIFGQLGCIHSDTSALRSRIQSLVTERSGTNYGPKDDLRLAALMSPEHRASKGITDPGPALRKRFLDRVGSQVRTQCVKRYAEEPFCDCVLTGLKARDVADADWETIGQNFDQLVQVARGRPQISEVVRACIRES